MDDFDLETKVGSTGDKTVSVEDRIRDHSLFQEIVNTRDLKTDKPSLSVNKSSNP